MDKIAVLIPCYNEEKTIAQVIRDAKAALAERNLPEICVKSDGEVVWNVWDEGGGTFRINMLNTD